MNIKKWRFNQGHKVALMSAAFLLMAVSAAKVTQDNMLKANDLADPAGVTGEEMGCYHILRSTGALIKCQPDGCFYPDGSVFEKTPENDRDIEFEVCRNEDGSERMFDDTMPHPGTYSDDGLTTDVFNGDYYGDPHQDDGFNDDFYAAPPPPPPYGDDQFDGKQPYNENGLIYDRPFEDGRNSDGQFDDDRGFEDNHHEDDGRNFDDNRNAQDTEREMERMNREVLRIEREVKRFERQLERAQQKGYNTGELEGLLGKVMTKLDEARQFKGQDNERFWWAIEDAREIMDFDLRDQINNLEQGANMERWLKDTERMYKDMEREVERLEKNGKNAPEIFSKLKKIMADARNYFNAGDFENAQWSLQDFQELSSDFWNSMEQFHRGDFEDDLRSRGGGMVKDIENGLQDAEEMIRKLEGEGKDVSRLKELLQKAEGLLDELRKAVDEDNGARIEEILDKLEFGLKDEFEREMMQLTGGSFDDAWDDAYKPRDVVEHFQMDDKQAEDIMERMMEKMSQKLMAKLMAKGLPSTVVQELLNSGFDDEVQKTFETVGFIDKGATEIVNNKVAILEKVKDIDEQIAELQKKKKIAMQKLNELEDVKERIANYNFASETGTEIKGKIEAFIQKAQESGASQSEIEAGIEELKQEAESAFRKAKEEKFEKGIIPFKDTDDDQWFTQFASEAKNKGLVKGTGTSGGTEFNPAGEANLSEAIVMFSRAIGAASDGSPSSAVGQRLPQWAQSAAAALEAKGVNLDEIFDGKQAGESVSRAEIARLLTQVFKLAGGDASGFSDIGDATDAEKEAIGAVNRAGMMTGEGGTDRFNVKGPLNRAALVKILSLAVDR